MMVSSLSAALLLGAAAAIPGSSAHAAPDAASGWCATPGAAAVGKAAALPLAAAGGSAADDWAPLPSTEHQHVTAAALVVAGKVMVAGGSTLKGEGQNSTEFLMASASSSGSGTSHQQTWLPGFPMLVPRSAHGAALVKGVAHLFGGIDHRSHANPKPATATAESLQSDGWRAAPSLPTPRTSVRAASLADGRALLVGGFLGGSANFSYLNSTLFFDGSRYTPGPQLPCPQKPPGHAPDCALSNIAVQECGGSVFAIGGSGEGPAYAAVWRLDVKGGAKAWVAAPPLPAATTWAGSACVQQQSVAAGGNHQTTQQQQQQQQGGGFTLFSIGGFNGEFRPTPTVYTLQVRVPL